MNGRNSDRVLRTVGFFPVSPVRSSSLYVHLRPYGPPLRYGFRSATLHSTYATLRIRLENWDKGNIDQRQPSEPGHEGYDSYLLS